MAGEKTVFILETFLFALRSLVWDFSRHPARMGSPYMCSDLKSGQKRRREDEPNTLTHNCLYNIDMFFMIHHNITAAYIFM